ncbi:MAG: hypothetical protein HYT03_02510 [Candidatus Harrisonbacteria bacterium]|nr:hypothetical protein [Candidatus Harrisonbacteria bacterium]
MRIIKIPIERHELLEIANETFGELIKAVVDIEKSVMAIGGELHSDEEVLLTENEGSKRENTWGINLYPKKDGDDWIEFDSMINIKPQYDNRSRDVEDPEIRKKIKSVVNALIT